MRFPIRWPVVIVVGVVLATIGLVGGYWDQIDHAAVNARHTTALKDLGANDVEARIRGMNELEQVTKASPGDQPAVVTELAAFIRSAAGSADCPDRPASRDVQAALGVLNRRPSAPDIGTVIDLHGACLRNAQMIRIELVQANLSGANLRGADLSWAVLDGADLRGADLAGANLSHAHAVAADLTSADLDGARTEGLHRA